MVFPREWCRVWRYVGPLILPWLNVSRFAVPVKSCSDVNECRTRIVRASRLN